jgi:hypothetical protein
MVSLNFTPGFAYLEALAPSGRWRVLFEDEGPAGYLYACDRTLGDDEAGIIDSMLIYNVSSLEEPTRERLASIQWSRSGLQALFYLDGFPQGFIDFETRQSFCRSNFPNFMEQQGDTWRSNNHAWDEAVISRFEADLYQ